ncbi:MAG: metallophosphoesterase family protein [Bacillota bacterium]
MGVRPSRHSRGGSPIRYAIISDIHANQEALLAVLAAIAAERIDRIVCLGDLVGYYANPNECVRLVEAQGIPCIRGNHDAVAAGLHEPIDFTETARHAILWTKIQLTSDTMDRLRQLPVCQVIDDQFVIVHGALHPQPNEHVRLNTPEQARESFHQLLSGYPGLRICFFGHTHHQAVYEWQKGQISSVSGECIALKSGAHYLANPGSVGQSRSSDPRAGFLVFDASAQTLQFHRIDYDWRLPRRKAEQAGLLPRRSLLRRSASWLWHHSRPARHRVSAFST